jgi:hypothetical protein
MLASLIGRHQDVSAIHDAPVPEQEGVYLQGAIPHTALHGTPGDFAHDPSQHLTEESRFNSLEVATRLAREWDPWFTPGGRWRVEKSPVNILRSRLYQQLFPMAHFIFLVRHPLAVSRATAKWSDKSEAALLDHWAAAHRILLDDLPYLHCALFLRYEDLCAHPGRAMRQVAAFLDLDPAPLTDDLGHVRDGNAGYLDTPGRPGLPDVAACFGYTADGTGPAINAALGCRHVFRSVREAVEHAGT